MIFLVRHGETDWNKLKKIQGREDIPLNEAGILQAHNCGRAFDTKNVSIDGIICSPLKRARETAKIIGNYVGVPNIKVHEALIEKDYGLVSGLTPEQREDFENSHDETGIESFESLSMRMMSVIYDLSNEAKTKNYIVVSHGAALNTVLSVLTDHKIGTGKTRLKNTAISEILCGDDKLELLDYNISPNDFGRKKE